MIDNMKNLQCKGNINFVYWEERIIEKKGLFFWENNNRSVLVGGYRFLIQGIKFEILADACTSLYGTKNHFYSIHSSRYILGKYNVVTLSEIWLKMMI